LSRPPALGHFLETSPHGRNMKKNVLHSDVRIGCLVSGLPIKMSWSCKKIKNFDEKLFVVDSMNGQDVVNMDKEKFSKIKKNKKIIYISGNKPHHFLIL